MEMTLTVHVPRRRPHPVDVVVEWSGTSTAAELCAALAGHLELPVPALAARGVTVPADAVVGMPPLLHGASVAVTTAGQAADATTGPWPRVAAALDLVVTGGPDAGRSHPLTPPAVAVGRAPGAGLVVADDAMSRRHLVVRTAPDGVTIEDCGSTNGVTVDGTPVAGVASVDVRSYVGAGSSTLRLRRAGGTGPPVVFPGDGTVEVTSGEGSDPVLDDLEIACPAAPLDRHRTRIPWIAAVAPVPVAIALAFFLGPQLLFFAALSPISLLAGALGDRWGAGRAHRAEHARHAGEVDQARRLLRQAVAGERERLDGCHPDPAATLAMAELRQHGVWAGGHALRVRLGLGDVPTRVVWVEGSARSRPLVARAPLVVDLGEVRCLGVVGPAGTTDGVLACLVGQLCVGHPPHRLSVHIASADPAWSWAERLPHVVPGWSPSPSPGELAPPGEAARRVRVLVVPAPRPESAALVRDAIRAGAVVLLGAPNRAGFPPECTSVVSPGVGRHVLDGPGGPQPFAPDVVGPWWRDRLSRALAPLRCTDGRDGSGIPSALTLREVLGGDDADPGRVLERWRASASTAEHADRPTLSAVVGRGSNGPWVVDLCRDGPHVLVGGTTGSGKSEFLRTLVTSLALTWPPDLLTFVLVDFKGGAAFGPCAGLPHVVGLVTDLDHHLVARALASLGAELRRRERLFAAVGANDLEGYQRLRTSDGEAVPRLVVVIDELRALVDELPEFVSGLVRLAALGRSLGVHLVLATQRPAGTISNEIQANVSLRIAFRVRDRADSVDVLDDGAAAGVPPATPGRGFARGADGSLQPFQAAVIGTRPQRVQGLSVRSGPDGSSKQTSLDEDVAAARGADEVVAVVTAAHRASSAGVPRAPWLAPLPDVIHPWVPGSPSTGSTTAHDASADITPSTHSARALPLLALVDEPDLQQVTRLDGDALESTWLLAGRAGSGRTTALRALTLAACAATPPGRLHVHVLDTHGSLADLDTLPHVGTRAACDDLTACRALVTHLRAEVDQRREAAAPGAGSDDAPAPTTLFVVDGWDHLLEAQPGNAADDLPGAILRLLRDGRSAGLVGAVSGGRSLLHPRWGGVAARTFLLGHVDPLDAALAGLRSTDLATDPPRGRATRIGDGREVQFARATPSDVAALSARAGARPATGGAWRHVALPTVLRRSDTPPGDAFPTSRHDPSGSGTEVTLGVAGTGRYPWCWHPEVHGRHLVVAGPHRSGRTNALRTIAESVCGAGRSVAVVRARGRVDGGHWPETTVHVGPDDAEVLIRLRWARPDLVVLVDDADRLDDAPVLPALHEILDLADRDGGLVAVATSTTALATRFRGLDVDAARARLVLLLNPASADRAIVDAPMPDGLPRVPGRGVFVSGGSATEVQVFLADGSVGGVAPRQHLGLGVSGHPGRPDRHQGQRDDQPALEHPGALHEAEPHRQQEDAPDDGGGARPRRGAEPAAGERPEPEAPEQDQQRRHEHPGGVAALPQDELDHVVHREADQGQGLHAGEHRGEAAGAA